MANRYKVFIDDVLQKEIKLEADLTGLSGGAHRLKIEKYQDSQLLETALRDFTVEAPEEPETIVNWGMKETSGPMVDAVHGINGTVGGGMTRSGSDYSFGSNAYVEVPDHDLLSFTDGEGNDKPFTIRMMVNFTNTSGTQWMLSKRDASGIEWQIANYDSNITIILRGANGNDMGRGFARGLMDTTSAWDHLVVTYDGSKTLAGLKMYLNNVRVDDRDTFAGAYNGMVNTDAKVYVGTLYQLPGYYFNGKMKDIVITNEIWGDSKRTNDYNTLITA